MSLELYQTAAPRPVQALSSGAQNVPQCTQFADFGISDHDGLWLGNSWKMWSNMFCVQLWRRFVEHHVLRAQRQIKKCPDLQSLEQVGGPFAAFIAYDDALDPVGQFPQERRRAIKQRHERRSL